MDSSTRTEVYKWTRDILLTVVLLPTLLAALKVPTLLIILGCIATLFALKAWERYPDIKASPVPERRFKMIALTGMIFFGAGFLACAAWYFWPVAIKSGITAPSASTATHQQFYSQQDKERLATLCSDLIGFLRDNGGDGGGSGAWKQLATLGNDWTKIGQEKQPDLSLLDKDLASARTSVAHLYEGLYGDTGYIQRNQAYHNELDSFFPPSKNYHGQIRGLQSALTEFGSAIKVLEAEKNPQARATLFTALNPAHEKFVRTIQEFQRNLFESTQRVEAFRKNIQPNIHAVSLEDVSNKIDNLAAIVKTMQAHRSELSRQPDSLAVVKLVRDQYERLENASKTFARMTGNPANKEEFGARLLNDLNLVLSNAYVTAKPAGDSLTLRTGPNTFRVLFPVPMRIAPRLTFHGLPAGVAPNVVENSDIGFTVIFTPQTVAVTTFGYEADAEL